MHEMSLAEGVVRLIEETALAERFERVRTVWLEIGRLASVEPEAIHFCFDAVTRGTCAEGARLEIVVPPGSAYCLQCDAKVEVAALAEACPQCGGYRLQVTGGTEMRLIELEVD
jgi:hydrogenase nickel incorporation protein HypA/HybF